MNLTGPQRLALASAIGNQWKIAAAALDVAENDVTGNLTAGFTYREAALVLVDQLLIQDKDKERTAAYTLAALRKACIATNSLAFLREMAGEVCLRVCGRFDFRLLLVYWIFALVSLHSVNCKDGQGHCA